jgi:hypothetical protein
MTKKARITLSLSVLSATITTAALAVDVALRNRVRWRVGKFAGGKIDVAWGVGKRMMIGATVLLWLTALGGAGCILTFPVRRDEKKDKPASTI